MIEIHVVLAVHHSCARTAGLADCAAPALAPHFSTANQSFALHPVGTPLHHDDCLTSTLWLEGSAALLCYVSGFPQTELSQLNPVMTWGQRLSCHKTPHPCYHLTLCSTGPGITTVVLLNGLFAFLDSQTLCCCHWDVLFFNKLHSADPRRH